MPPYFLWKLPLCSNSLELSLTRPTRRVAEHPELRIISRAGEEVAADTLGISGFQSWGRDDYVLAEIKPDGASGRCYIVLGPQDIFIVKARDRRDHVDWLVDRQRYEGALEELEKLGDSQGGDINASEIGRKYVQHLVVEDELTKAAHSCPKMCGQNVKRWEDDIHFRTERPDRCYHRSSIVPYVRTENPKLDRLPKDTYDMPSVAVALESELDKALSSSKVASGGPETTILMECLAEPENNLFADVRDQALLLVEFDQELFKKQKQEKGAKGVQPDAEDATIYSLTTLTPFQQVFPRISSRVELTPLQITRVVQQLQVQSYFLFLYLHTLSTKDPLSTVGFGDTQVRLYAEYANPRLIDFLRGRISYNLELGYNICQDHGLVPEMVFLLDRVNNSRQALTIIIERMGDANRAIEFAKEQNDDLWEDLLRSSETRPSTYELTTSNVNVGAGIDPIRLIRRIKNGLV
ncbi:hypothetical protein BDM02DRAFT_3131353 [Thelephora ganbajun]|uniref:Uncharacterized protein n=1 Tax=Thelephora ganbajun TaxID=370292 RepID=A0ACB6Z605_THEGA|nr:hypothetical protein BDM02DRAFT_3131353 [Thelephora ganbajun]